MIFSAEMIEMIALLGSILFGFGTALPISGPVCKHTLSASSGEAPVIKVRGGLVRGCENDRGVTHFNVPYGEPPVGDLRFRAPQPKQPWEGVLDGTGFLTMCPQIASFGQTNHTFFLGDEDCLGLAVHVPPNATGPLPVLFWIYGG